MTDSLEPRYDAQKIEPEIYKQWEESGFFNPDNLFNAEKKTPFTIIMPPPNANGDLHAGHALFITIEDILTRYHRMKGDKTVWLPGADHAGFETQIVYERKLGKEGRSRFGMDPKILYDEIMAFTLENKKNMESQVRSLGASCDWSRERFTLDPNIIEEVQKTFEKMYKDGLVYRGKRIVNWCSKHQTSLSDVETEFREQTDPFYYLKYGPFTIGTARPETKFGDKYVVMHPDDPRYKNYKEGQKIELEWINGPITATIVKDKAIDMEFGTGVMTITPWHDTADFEIAERHNLDKAQIIDFQGKLLPIAGEFAGMPIGKARPRIVEKLKEKGLLVKVDETYAHNVRVCYKCGTTIEPQIMDQWFVKMKPLAEKAIAAVKAGKVTFIPDRYEKIFYYWMEHTLDWNISRQIVWGIRIPAWFCLGTPEKIMGFAGDVVPQVFDTKTRTYRLRDHGHHAGDKVFFENSQTGEVFSYGTITEVQKTTVGEIDLKDQKHWKVYETRDQLIAAFKRHHPEMDVTDETPVWIYTYTFIQESRPKTCYNVKINPNIKARWFLVRHGETDWNNQKIVQGHSETPLNETGRKQAKEAGEVLKKHDIDLIISSDLPRTKETAEIISKITGAEILSDKGFRERFLGKAEGLLQEEVAKTYPDIREYESTAAESESLKELEKRAWMALKKHRQDHAHKNVAIITHGGTIRMLMKRLKNLSFVEAITRKVASNCEVIELDILDPCEKCGNDLFEQDPDVFDTWFSSGQWPLLTLGFPDGKDFKTFYPTDVMETGSDLIFRWVPRMIIFGLYLTNEVPFHTVYLHGLVNDAKGRKMSKSKGNVVNPLELMAKYGADALRIGLVAGNTPGTDLALSEDKIRGYRNFSTKIWNIGRFILMHKPEKLEANVGGWGKNHLEEFESVKKEVTEHIDNFEFHLAAEKAYHYVWHTFADKTIEEAKPHLQKSEEEKAAAYETLETIFIGSLKLLHPFMPFVTEALYQKFRPRELLMVAPW